MRNGERFSHHCVALIQRVCRWSLRMRHVTECYKKAGVVGIAIGNEWYRSRRQGHAPDDGRECRSVKRSSERGVLSVRNPADFQGDGPVRGVVMDDPGEVSWVLGQEAVR